MSARRCRLAGAELVATLSGALVWPDARTMVIADLHLEKATSRAGAGVLLPPYDSRASLSALADDIRRWRPHRVIALGDSFHDRRAGDRLADGERDALVTMATESEWIWIAGNHDPAPPPDLGGRVVRSLRIGPLTFRHHAADVIEAGEVSGHFHPKVVIGVAGRRISARCFVVDDRRLILPAYGAFTGGLRIDDWAIQSLFPDGATIYALGHRRVHVLPARRRPCHHAAPTTTRIDAAGDA